MIFIYILIIIIMIYLVFLIKNLIEKIQEAIELIYNRLNIESEIWGDNDV